MVVMGWGVTIGEKQNAALFVVIYLAIYKENACRNTVLIRRQVYLLKSVIKFTWGIPYAPQFTSVKNKSPHSTDGGFYSPKSNAPCEHYHNEEKRYSPYKSTVARPSFSITR